MSEILISQHLGFCYGVKHSIEMACNTLNNKNFPRPIYLLNSIVHNHFVNTYFISKGIIIINEQDKMAALNKITKGTIIIPAHGIKDEMRNLIEEKGLTLVDATCPFVEKSYQLIKKYLNNNYHILYYGKPNHPETLSVTSFSTNVTLLDNNVVLPNNDLVAFAHQTTMSDYDVEHIYQKYLTKIPKLIKLPMLCNATETRQKELINLLETNNLSTLYIIVGDLNSNNCNKLYELAKRYTINVIFVDGLNTFLNLNLPKYEKYVITSGTSTPYVSVKEIYHYLKYHKINKRKTNSKEYII